MLEAYFVYSFVFILLIVSSLIRLKNKPQFSIYFAIVISSIILGLRYNVGNDYIPYKEIFIYQNFEAVEWGYALLNKILYNVGFPYSSIFILIAFLQLFFFYKGIERYPRIVPYAFFFYFSTAYIFFSLNVMRQALAFSMFVYALNFIQSRHVVKYAIVVLIASAIHKSAIVLLPLYFLLNRDYLKSLKLQYALYFFTFFLGKIIQEIIWDNFALISRLAGYESYAKGVESLKDVNWAKEGGIGFILWMIIDLWVIFYSQKFREHYKQSYVNSVYHLYFLGLLLTNCIQGTYFDRANVYFSNMRIVVYAFFFLYILQADKKLINRMMVYGVLAILIIFFYMAIYNKAGMCAPFQFI